ncbi:MAG: hypothetical protein NT163_09410 [Chlorobiales bacterium]|nr:hypothetical protein [Chlorobiales bacterium]
MIAIIFSSAWCYAVEASKGNYSLRQIETIVVIYAENGIRSEAGDMTHAFIEGDGD